MCFVSKGDRHIIEKCNDVFAKNDSDAKTGWPTVGFAPITTITSAL